jgi:hypothetical protein
MTSIVGHTNLESGWEITAQDGGVIVLLRDEDGMVVRALPPLAALDLGASILQMATEAMRWERDYHRAQDQHERAVNAGVS